MLLNAIYLRGNDRTQEHRGDQNHRGAGAFTEGCADCEDLWHVKCICVDYVFDTVYSADMTVLEEGN